MLKHPSPAGSPDRTKPHLGVPPITAPVVASSATTCVPEKLTQLASRQIIAAVTGPAPVRRIKSYSAASGFVYQYQFYESHPARGATPGNEYIYYVSADRKTMFPLRIVVLREAVENWAKKYGRALNGTEEYAIAKMRLFQAFDEVEGLSAAHTPLVVDDSNLESLLAQLNLD